MKKQFLFILSVLFTATLVNAQDITSYRGAFAPAPVRQWTEDWTNWNPQNTAYGTPNVIVNADINGNVTWTANNVYLLDTVIYVNNGATLTIEPGTVIRGDLGNASLLVAKGGKLIAEGTQCKPIVFTSNQAAGSRTPGSWGGILILGKANNNTANNQLIEGLVNTDTRNFHGGTDNADNSGILKYVRIEYPGFIFSTNNEINGLTMGSVGSGTTIDYVQVTLSADDSYEWFGGAVNAKHLIAYQGRDDDWDTDNGYSGYVQYGLSIKDPNISDASQSEGFESDGNSTGAAITPKTTARFLNITQIGAFRCASNTSGTGVAPTALFLHRRGARVRRNSELKISNSILMNNWRGLFIDSATVTQGITVPVTLNYDNGTAQFRNNIIAGDFTTTWTGTTYNGTKSLAYENAATRVRGTIAAYANDSVHTCSLLTDAWNANPALADFRPNGAFAGTNPVTDPTNLNAGADLSPIVQTDGGLFTANQTSEFLVAAIENGTGATTDIITVTIPKLSGWDIKVPGSTPGSFLTLSSTPQTGFDGTTLGNPTNNGSWLFSDDGNNIIITSKPGVVIAKSDVAVLGFAATRKGSTSNGTNQNLGVFISGGGDTTPANNTGVTSFSAN